MEQKGTTNMMWEELENAPNIMANIIKVHHDMMAKIPSISKAKIQGYPLLLFLQLEYLFLQPY